MRKTPKVLVGLIGLFCAGTATAALSPKFDRAEQMDAAVGLLGEVALLLDDPIDRIEYVNAEVRFVAGKCYVSVAIKNANAAAGKPGGAAYSGEIGKKICH